MRLIDADALKRNFEANTPVFAQDLVPGICAIIDRARTIDAVPVRCGECKHYWQTKRGQFIYFEECILDKLQNPSEDDFCSYGESKEDGTD